MYRIPHMLLRRRCYNSLRIDGVGGGGVGAKSGKRRVRLLPKAKLRGIVDPAAKNGRLSDSATRRQSARSAKWP